MIVFHWCIRYLPEVAVYSTGAALVTLGLFRAITGVPPL